MFQQAIAAERQLPRQQKRYAAAFSLWRQWRIVTPQPPPRALAVSPA
jgi:hypothetical protein